MNQQPGWGQQPYQQPPQVIVVQNKNTEGCFGCLWAIFWFVLVAGVLGAVAFCVMARR